MSTCVAPHRIINPSGRTINLPQFVIDALSGIHLVERNGGLPHLSSGIYRIMHYLDVLDGGPPPLRAIDYSRSIYSQTRGGRPNRILAALGHDLAGVTTWVDCKCEECRRKDEDADNTPVPFGC